jgi:uncharacterized MAPEG superfamily protein
MSIELQMLGWAIALGLVHILFAATLSTSQRGLAWNASNRDQPAPPLTGMALRSDNARRNLLETFPLFAAAVLAVTLLDRETAQTALGAQIYFWARVAYLPVYAIGIPYVRSLIWVASLWGLLQVLYPLF